MNLELKLKQMDIEFEEGIRSETFPVKTGCGTMNIQLVGIKPHLRAVFISFGKAGGCGSSQTEALGKLLTYLCQSDTLDPEWLAKKLHGIECHNQGLDVSCATAVGKAISLWLKDN